MILNHVADGARSVIERAATLDTQKQDATERTTTPLRRSACVDHAGNRSRGRARTPGEALVFRAERRRDTPAGERAERARELELEHVLTSPQPYGQRPRRAEQDARVDSPFTNTSALPRTAPRSSTASVSTSVSTVVRWRITPEKTSSPWRCQDSPSRSLPRPEREDRMLGEAGSATVAGRRLHAQCDSRPLPQRQRAVHVGSPRRRPTPAPRRRSALRSSGRPAPP